ncbi:MAG: PIG-L family deacetylase [bacterium]|nr:PIG-L family deacetylase [bacterium]
MTAEAPRRLLAVFPHPDDEAYGCAGALSRACADTDTTVGLLTLTDGEASTALARAGHSPEQVAALRRERMHAVAEILGLDHLALPGLPDGRLARLDLEALAAPVREALGTLNPQVVIAHDPRGVNGHADHIAAHFAVRLALQDRPDVRLAMVSYPPALVASMLPRLMFATKEEEIDAEVTLDPRELAAKERCLRIHDALVTLTDDGPDGALRRPPVEYYDFLGESFPERRAGLFEDLPRTT